MNTHPSPVTEAIYTPTISTTWQARAVQLLYTAGKGPIEGALESTNKPDPLPERVES